MEHWSERLRAWMRDAGLKVPDLARVSGVSEDSLYKYLKGRTDAPRGDVLARIAAALGKTPVELRYGVDIPAVSNHHSIPLMNISALKSKHIIIPAIETWRGPRVLVPAFEADATAIAVEIRDNACAPKIEAGDVVVVDFEMARAPGDYVLAYVAALDVTVCRRYRPRHATRDDVFELAALNADFPAMQIADASDGHLIGRVVRVVKTL